MNILWGNFKSHSKPHKYFYAASNKEYLWEFNKFSSVVGKWRKDFINFPVCATSMPHIIHGLCRKELPTRLSSAGLICANIGVFLSNDNHWYSMSRSQICIHYVTKRPFGPFKELFEGTRDPLKAKKLTHPSKDIKNNKISSKVCSVFLNIRDVTGHLPAGQKSVQKCTVLQNTTE